MSETKLDETFPNKQFEIQGYKTLRKDSYKHGGGVIFYLNKNIPCGVLDIDFNFNDLETIFLEFSLKNRKWLCVGLYKPSSQNVQYFLDNINKSLTKLSSQFNNIILLGDFKSTSENWNLDTFMSCFDLESLIKVPTCFQSTNPTFIDLILTNKKNFFKNSNVLEVGISDHYYRDYKNFDIETFKPELSSVLSVSKKRRLFNFSRYLY